MTEFDDDMTLGEARDLLRTLVKKGHHCPLCTQYARVYRRPLNAGIARALILMYLRGGTDWIHKPTVLNGIGAAARDESISRYWGLTEEEIERREDGGRAGWWRITEDGERWVRRQSTVSKYALIYDQRCLGFDGPQVTIVDALGDRFDWRELMNS